MYGRLAPLHVYFVLFMKYKTVVDVQQIGSGLEKKRKRTNQFLNVPNFQHSCFLLGVISYTTDKG